MPNIAIDKIRPNPQQPRTVFEQDEIEAKAVSMQAVGLINPVAVTEADANGVHYLIDGERRWRAAQLLGWSEIEASIKRGNQTDTTMLLQALIANIQRADMGPVDRAYAYARLRDDMGLSVPEIAARVGRSESHIYNLMRLVNGDQTLAPEVLDLLNRKRLPYDQSVLSAFRTLPHAQQAQVAKRAAVNQASGTHIKTVITRLRNANQFKTPRRAQPKPGRKPAPDVAPPFRVYQVQDAALAKDIEAVCIRCGFEGVICQDCPMVELAQKLQARQG